MVAGVLESAQGTEGFLQPRPQVLRRGRRLRTSRDELLDGVLPAHFPPSHLRGSTRGEDGPIRQEVQGAPGASPEVVAIVRLVDNVAFPLMQSRFGPTRSRCINARHCSGIIAGAVTHADDSSWRIAICKIRDW